MTILKVTAIYKAQIGSAGYLRTHSVREETRPGFTFATGQETFGFEITKKARMPYFARDLRSTVLVLEDNSVWISREVFGAILDSYMWSPEAKIGSRGYQHLTDELVDEFIYHNSYPRRSKREEEVQTRNNQLIEWLMGLVK